MIYKHADDYAYSLNTSKDILKLLKDGKLESISILPNMPAFEDSMELLYKEIPNLPFLPRMSVHLNFVEGYNLSQTFFLSRNGINNASWGMIFITSLGSNKGLLKGQLKKEIKVQIEKVQEVINKCINIAKDSNVVVKQSGIRIDSHTHTHPIPVVFKALCEVIEEENLNVEYIRNPKEPIVPFVKNIKLGYRPVNFVKNIILNIFSSKIDKYSREHSLNQMFIWGLIMSGKMDENRIQKIYPSMKQKAIKSGRDLEILFHPGLATKEEICEQMNGNNFTHFNSTDNRTIEFEAANKITLD